MVLCKAKVREKEEKSEKLERMCVTRVHSSVSTSKWVHKVPLYFKVYYSRIFTFMFVYGTVIY